MQEFVPYARIYVRCIRQYLRNLYRTVLLMVLRVLFSGVSKFERLARSLKLQPRTGMAVNFNGPTIEQGKPTKTSQLANVSTDDVTARQIDCLSPQAYAVLPCAIRLSTQSKVYFRLGSSEAAFR